MTRPRDKKAEAEILKALKWNVRSEYHWQAMLDDSIIDYWPTKRKWRHESMTKTGNVLDYIAAFKAPISQLAAMYHEMDEDRQAAFLKEIGARKEQP